MVWLAAYRCCSSCISFYGNGFQSKKEGIPLLFSRCFSLPESIRPPSRSNPPTAPCKKPAVRLSRNSR
ncbi:hypothetical protein D1157_16800 [Anaerotruncus sp. X29]|nr:hypothetical protein [Anaerotruncus sp. 1XD42-93]NCE76621.1 hypothetical protein [Anaerotruncus sp. X29]RKJ76426.1 hypothetical protein D7Y41_31900 [Anaerotruncus sp. 1XD22-93]